MTVEGDVQARAEAGMVATMPYIAMPARAKNVRKSFLRARPVPAILKHLPSEYHALFEIAYITGWRMRSELLTRKWRHVDFGGEGWLRIDAGEAKDATGWPRVSVHGQYARGPRTSAEVRVESGEAHQGGDPVVFYRPDGVRIHRFYEPWRDACKALASNASRTSFAGRCQELGTCGRSPDHGDGDDRPQDGVDLPAIQHRRSGDARKGNVKARSVAATSEGEQTSCRLDAQARMLVAVCAMG
jgi:integrase